MIHWLGLMCKIMHHFKPLIAPWYTIVPHWIHCEPLASLVHNGVFGFFLMQRFHLRQTPSPTNQENTSKCKPECHESRQIQHFCWKVKLSFHDSREVFIPVPVRMTHTIWYPGPKTQNTWWKEPQERELIFQTWVHSAEVAYEPDFMQINHYTYINIVNTFLANIVHEQYSWLWKVVPESRGLQNKNPEPRVEGGGLAKGQKK
jgi:hypothetical protein